MAFYEVTITGSKVFIVEAGSEEEALNNAVVYDEMSSIGGDIEWVSDGAEALLEGETIDIEQCNRHMVKVFDKDGEEIEA